MEELIEDMVEPEEKKLLKEIPMYVLSNQKRVFGAAGLLYDRVLSDSCSGSCGRQRERAPHHGS